MTQTIVIIAAVLAIGVGIEYVRTCVLPYRRAKRDDHKAHVEHLLALAKSTAERSSPEALLDATCNELDLAASFIEDHARTWNVWPEILRFRAASLRSLQKKIADEKKGAYR